MTFKPEQKTEVASILVVDDEPFMQMQIRLYLQRQGYQIFGASDGLEALKIYATYQPDLVLLDALMPVMDGFECCRQLSQNTEKSPSPILMITGLEDEQSVDLAFEAGATDYITKPIHWAVLRQRVRRLLQQTRLQRQLEAANQQLQKLALLDSLTQINNRRAFDLYIEQEWRHCAREKQPLALILIDVDYFKCYNDFYGHPAGDVCLQKIAQLLQNSVTRATDCVARYGGEEFAIILPNTNQEGAILVGERILTNIRHLAIPHIGSAIKSDPGYTSDISDIPNISEVCLLGAKDYVTLSLGLAVEVPKPNFGFHLLIQEADKYLFRAKHQGRDRLAFRDEGESADS